MCIDFNSNEIIPSPGPIDSFVPFACRVIPGPGPIDSFVPFAFRVIPGSLPKQNKTKQLLTTRLLWDASQAASPGYLRAHWPRCALTGWRFGLAMRSRKHIPACTAYTPHEPPTPSTPTASFITEPLKKRGETMPKNTSSP